MTILFDPHPGQFRTWQEACTYAYVQVMKQGRASMKHTMKVNESVCAYRGAADCKCFVGHIIPDSKYNGSFENLVVHDPSVWDTITSVVLEKETWGTSG